MIRIWLIVLVVASALARYSIAAPPSGDDLVHATLFADVSAVEPGKPFTVGVLFKIQPNWHIYWSNPGDAGEATDVKFNLPAGSSAGNLLFPVPERIAQPGDIVSYGYENEVMLLATITPSSDLKTGETFHLSADAIWLVCEKICLPGKATVQLDLPVAAKSQPANAELFARWKSEVPVKPEQAGAQVSVLENAMDANRAVTIVAHWNDKAPANVQWFPPASDICNFSSIKVLPKGQNVTISAMISPLPGKSLRPDMTFESVIAYDDPAGSGTRRGISVSIPLR